MSLRRNFATLEFRRQMWRHGKISAHLRYRASNSSFRSTLKSEFATELRDNLISIPKIYLFKKPSKTVHALQAMNAKSSATFEKKRICDVTVFLLYLNSTSVSKFMEGTVGNSHSKNVFSDGTAIRTKRKNKGPACACV